MPGKIPVFGAAATALLMTGCAPAIVADPTPELQNAAPEQCLAPYYQHYVGRPVAELPAAPTGDVWRTVCTTCPVTLDHDPRRVTFLFDEPTGVIREIKCG
jgi:hypothetical protein